MPLLLGLLLGVVLRGLLWPYVRFDVQPSFNNKLWYAIWPNLGLIAVVLLLPIWLVPQTQQQVYLLSYGFPGAFVGNMGAALIFAYFPRMTPDYHKKIWGTHPR